MGVEQNKAILKVLTCGKKSGEVLLVRPLFYQAPGKEFNCMCELRVAFLAE